MPNDWYESVGPTTRLTQGDLIFNCPIVVWKSELPQFQDNQENEVLRGAMEVTQADVVVMTQACDLEHDKVNEAVLCPHLSLTEFRTVWEEEMRRGDQNPTERAWKRFCNAVCEGSIWNLAILNAIDISEPSLEHRIVDFHYIYTVPRIFLESLLVQRNQHRFRLLPPYREHLSQAFARFFMRVGLPVGVTVAW
jgi:hypothetical protein